MQTRLIKQAEGTLGATGPKKDLTRRQIILLGHRYGIPSIQWGSKSTVYLFQLGITQTQERDGRPGDRTSTSPTLFNAITELTQTGQARSRGRPATCIALSILTLRCLVRTFFRKTRNRKQTGHGFDWGVLGASVYHTTSAYPSPSKTSSGEVSTQK